MKQKTATVKQIQELDRAAIERVGIPSLALMENAGRCVAEEVLKVLKKKMKVCVICGLGNNAGDGFVAARYLINHGVKAKIWLIGRADQLKNDAKVNYMILKKMGYPITSAGAGREPPLRDIRDSDVVVDAVFGVGLNRKVGEPFRSFIEAINKHAKKTIAVDIPSGLDGTSGKIYGVCVRADRTVTFTFMKKGFLTNEGPRVTGKVVVVDIGIPKWL